MNNLYRVELRDHGPASAAFGVRDLHNGLSFSFRWNFGVGEPEGIVFTEKPKIGIVTIADAIDVMVELFKMMEITGDELIFGLFEDYHVIHLDGVQ